MRKRSLKAVALILIASALLSLALPVFSANGVVLHGYDMVTLSIFGVLICLAVILLLLVTLWPFPRRLQSVILLIVLIAGTVCYVEAAWLARLWLQWNAGALIHHHFGLVVYPQIMLLAVITAWRRNIAYPQIA